MQELNSKLQLFDLEPDLLSAFLQDRAVFIDFFEHLNASYFVDKNASDLFKIFKAYFTTHKEMPSENKSLSLFRKYDKSEEDIILVKRVYSRSPFRKDEIDDLREEIKKFIKTEKIKKVLIAGATLVSSKNLDDFVDIEKQMREVAAWSPDVDLGISLVDVERRYDRAEQEEGRFIQSPWDSVNSVLNGGFRVKQLHAFISNSSVGKSIAIDQCALHTWMKGGNVVLISLELSEIVKSQRIDAALLQKPISQLLINKKEVVSGYKQFQNMKNKLYIKEFPTSSVSVSAIEQYIYQLQIYDGLKNIDLICIDYGDLLMPKGHKKTGNEYMDQGTVFEEMRALAQIYDTVVISATQLNRSAVGSTIDEINESKIGDSMKKMRTLDTLIALHNTPDEREEGILNFKTLKNRSGEKDIILQMQVDYKTLRIFE